jgi:tetratricopeptide (TPR) repeat protein
MMMMMMRSFAIVCLLAAVAYAQVPADAERLYTEGQQAYDAKNYDAALAAWERSYELSKLPALVFNIAQAHRLRGNCAKAVASYRKFIELEPESSERADAEGFIKDLEPCPVVTPPPPPPKKLPPERPVITETNPGRGKRIAGIVVGVGGVALIATGVVFGTKASSLADEVKAECADNDCNWETIRDKDADGRSAERTQFIFYGVGAAAMATAGVLYWLGSRETAPVTVTPRGDGATVTWTRRW